MRSPVTYEFFEQFIDGYPFFRTNLLHQVSGNTWLKNQRITCITTTFCDIITADKLSGGVHQIKFEALV